MPPSASISLIAVSNGLSLSCLKNSDTAPTASVILSIDAFKASSNVSKNAIFKSSVADLSIANLASNVSSISVAILCPAPVAFSNCVASSPTVPEPSNRTLKALTALCPTSSFISAVPIPSSVSLFKASISSSELLTEPPSLVDSFDDSLDSSKNICLNAVPAMLPSIPAFASVPSIAVVSSTLKPATLATGATNDIELANLDISNAVLENDSAITSVSLVVSPASSPKALNVLPAISAVEARSVPNAVDRFSVPSVTCNISSDVKPSLLNSI